MENEPTGHRTWVASLQFSPDGTLLASGSWDETVKIWDVAKRQYLRSLRDHVSWVEAVAWHPNSLLVASGGMDSLIRFWDARYVDLIETYEGHRRFALDPIRVDIFRKVDTMSRMATKTRRPAARRQFTEEFKAGAVRLVLDEGKTVGAVARELDLTASALRPSGSNTPAPSGRKARAG